MKILIDGRLKGGKVVLLPNMGRGMNWFRRMFIFRHRSRRFSVAVPVPEAGFSEKIEIPGPVDAWVRASLVAGRLALVFDVVTDKLGVVVGSFEYDASVAGERRPFSLKAFGAEVSGTVELV